ncbi:MULTISPECIES: SDR family oxidoreductase [Paenibacillus]|uniref:Short-chain dehydrogenase-reductase SDR n=1 Tax=Paenibacillus illinoisensis TaxID=59845 RepID=A0A2W0CAH9_9BACL|nr:MULTISPECIES: SDR family oxidoreductase [Paenibacillus]MBM6383244.1 SDR family oxidoreductase [Paenibacillus sp.]PAD29626.1 short-chain dehydrogenase [Paenibacillus sp. 7523-1]PYY27579.1 Short-chain dehydrogenase-reductase SDR [Paenibacillus illinoisensis]
MSMKTAIVTGANSGMGLATTIQLARQGYRVIMACRSEKRGQQALQEALRESGSTAIELILCDLGSTQSIRHFARSFRERYSTLDVLVNNAGVVMLKRQETSDGFEQSIGINHLGHFLLTLLLIQPLQAAEQGRVVNVSSGAYKAGKIHFDDPHLQKGYNPIKSYAQSKLANVLFTRALSRKVANSRVTVNCLHPGAVGTSIGVDRNTGFGTRIMAFIGKLPFFLSPEEGAQTAIYLATSPEVAEITGRYFYQKKEQKLKAHAVDDAVTERFWTWSEQQVGLKPDEKLG